MSQSSWWPDLAVIRSAWSVSVSRDRWSRTLGWRRRGMTRLCNKVTMVCSSASLEGSKSENDGLQLGLVGVFEVRESSLVLTLNNGIVEVAEVFDGDEGGCCFIVSFLKSGIISGGGLWSCVSSDGLVRKSSGRGVTWVTALWLREGTLEIVAGTLTKDERLVRVSARIVGRAEWGCGRWIECHFSRSKRIKM